MYEVVRRKGKIVRRMWKCAYCRKDLKGPLRETKDQRIVREFRGGLSMVGLARKYGMTSERVQVVIRKAL